MKYNTPPVLPASLTAAKAAVTSAATALNGAADALAAMPWNAANPTAYTQAEALLDKAVAELAMAVAKAREAIAG